MNKKNMSLLLLSTLLISTSLAGPAADVGEKLDNAGQYVAEKAGDAWEATKKGAKNTGEFIGDKSSDAWEATKKGAKNVKEALDPRGPAEKAGSAVDEAAKKAKK
ncbi:hypothetical protein IB642_01635 [Allofrancisella guangzhouensis]|uniref:Uncharacterized protein n=1 Tax=Allofrancisella guangzhouensis TaxID=594679 RepID=A0A0A8E5H2_9GAMM|nr:hypothetical protein [Allofrancisella guangzhouensis]AJC49199.1 hypothetical protein SD28_05910 [Allofrancisella guangzhouensis]MBK2027324.1 hypothetical protein [Allofrancisella guangzhouensis]MBK2043718.1 hypothetical protein [Allofrancisella guangzhouensis]MBK2045310.1 hypothetical protein [Allofrancisella guangzhouensis]